MVLIVLIIILGYVIWYIRDQKQCEGAPPGPVRFPSLGNIIQVAVQSSIPPLALYKLSRIYGDVMSVRIGLIDFGMK
ncbi:unnamed protein product [Orchesella dallaii]|uniref:Cytochrome P450 n=1 Tax=Orchesella dallaii TaxID=48710 RepID=A0ABP1PNS4_9HEXA